MDDTADKPNQFRDNQQTLLSGQILQGVVEGGERERERERKREGERGEGRKREGGRERVKYVGSRGR